jgi:hypothetical protein
MPIRLGKLVRTWKLGTRYFVEFALEKLVCLPAPDEHNAAHRWVERFTEDLNTRVAVTPYERSASLGNGLPAASEPAPPWDAASEPDLAFERSVEYLSKTETFQASHFYRVRRLLRAGDEEPIPTGNDGVLELQAGRTYELELLHSQPSTPPVPRRFLVDVDGATLRLIGHRAFDIASRYDQPLLRVLATPAAGIEDRETVIDIRPDEGVTGPTLSLPVRVVADTTRAATIAGLQALALIAVALAGTVAFASHGVRIGVAVAGALLAATLQLLGWAPLRTPTIPSASPAAPSASTATHPPPAPSHS